MLCAVPAWGNELEPRLSAVRREEAKLDDVPDQRLAVGQDSCGPRSQQRHILERSYRVTGERHT